MPPSALGTLKKRPYKARPVNTAPQDITDVDALLADTKDFLAESPTDPTATALAAADIDASLERQRATPLVRGPNVGVVGALADSIAKPIRVMSGFGGPMLGGAGEAVAQGLESVAYADGKPLPAGGSMVKDATRVVGQTALGALFGRIGGGLATEAAKRVGSGTMRGLAAKLGVGAVVGGAEGAAVNTAQGAAYRAFDENQQAFDPEAMKLDAGLGFGIGATTGGALGALQARSARGANLLPHAAGPQPINARLDADGRTLVYEAPSWEARDVESFQRNQANMGDNIRLRQPNGGTVRGPAPRQRRPPVGVAAYGDTPAPVGPNPQRQLPAPSAIQLPGPPQPEVGTAAVTPPQGGSPRYDVLAPTTYQGPAGDPTANPPGVPPTQHLPEPGPSVEDILAAGAADPLPPPAPTAPQLPRGRFGADDPSALAAEPFAPPVAEPPAPNRDDFWAAMDEVAARPEPTAPVAAAEGSMVAQPFDLNVPPAIQKATSNPAYGTPVRVTYDGKDVLVHYREKPGAPTRMGLSHFEAMFPGMEVPRAPGAPPAPGIPDGPSFRDDPATLEALDALATERSSAGAADRIEADYGAFEEGDLERLFALESPADVPVVRADAETNRFAVPQEDMQPAPEMGDDEIARLLRQADEQDASIQVEKQEVEPARINGAESEVMLLDPDDATTQNNASGDSSASVEAMNREAAMKARGQQFMKVDRAGIATPLIGTDAVDWVPPRGFSKVIRHADGRYEMVQDNGGRTPMSRTSAEEYAAKMAPEERANFERAGGEAGRQARLRGLQRFLSDEDSTVADIQSQSYLEDLDAGGTVAEDAMQAGRDAERGADIAASAADELDAIVLEDTPAPAEKPALFDDAPPVNEPVVASEAPATPRPENSAAAQENGGIALGDGDTPGTINQAGKFVSIDREGWQNHEPGKNKNLVVRKADGTYQVVKNNGGKTPKRWDAEKAAIREEQARAKAEQKAAREAEARAKLAAKPQASPEPVAAPGPVAAVPTTAPADTPNVEAPAPKAEGPSPAQVSRDTFGEKLAVDVRFERAPNESVRLALKEYGFRYIPHKQKWSFAIPKDIKNSLTQDEVEAAVQAILRGESVESVQTAINAQSGSQKAAKALGGDWPGDIDSALDRGLSDDQRSRLRDLGWTKETVEGRRTWFPPSRATEAPRAPEVPPANPPQAEAPSVPSASAETPQTSPASSEPPTTSEPGRDADAESAASKKPWTAAADDAGAASRDEIRVPADRIKVDADAYQFKTVGVDERGRNEKLKGVGGWREQTNKLNRVMLHERLDGSLYVVDGHQRVGLAQDLKAQGKDVPDLYAVVLRESEGVTVDDARREGAMENLVGGTTDPLDIARVMRSGDLTPEEQAQVGRIQAESGERFRQGRDLAKLSDEAFTFALQADIEPRYSRLVSQYDGAKLQVAMLKALSNSEPQNVSAAKSLLAKVADAHVTESQPNIFGEVEVSSNYEELVQFEQKVLGIFKKNRRLFGKSADNAAFLEQAGETRIDREAMANISTEAGKAEFLFDKFANASGSHTKRAIQEAFDEYEAGKLSLGAASDRIAKALEADFTGRAPSGEADTGIAGEGPTRQDGPGLFGDDAEGGSLFDAGAVAEGRDSLAIEDAADDVLDFLKRAGKKLLDDEKGELNLEGLGEGLQGLEAAYKRNPGAVWTGLRAVGGAFAGAALHDEDEDATIIDNLLLGAAAGVASKRVPGIARALARKAPTLARDIRAAVETGRLLANGTYKAQSVVRKAPDLAKDISGFAKLAWSPDKVVPDVWKHIEPIMQDIYTADADAKLTPDQRLVARKARVEEAVAYMKQAAKGSRDAGHARRAQYIDALRDELLNKPTFLEKQVQDLSNGKVTPKRVRQVNAVVTNAIYHNLLGWAVDSGLANMTQALMNIPQIGVKSTVKGIVRAYSKQGRQELAFLNLNRRPMGQDEERLFHPWLEKYLDWSQYPMRLSDSANRRATYAGAMDYAAKRGFSESQAKAFANELVGQTQGIAGDLGNNPFHRHLGPLRVFTKFPLVWGSMLQDIATHPDARVKLRALGMLTGIYAFSAISGVEAINFFWPRMGGLPGPSAAVDVMSHAFGAPDHELEEHFEMGGTEDRLTPRYLNKFGAVVNRFEAQGDGPHTIVGRKGQELRDVSAEEDLLSLFGVETTDRAETRRQESEMYESANDARREEGIRSRRIRREAGMGIALGDEGRRSRALEALSNRQRRDFLRDREMTPRERARRMTPLRRREEFDREYGR